LSVGTAREPSSGVPIGGLLVQVIEPEPVSIQVVSVTGQTWTMLGLASDAYRRSRTPVTGPLTPVTLKRR
jgi:hypothetical protein